jgi:tetratricopeptide (TPR) repeat protein
MIHYLKTQITTICPFRFVKIPCPKVTPKLRFWSIFSLLTSLFFYLVTGTASAQCLTSGLTEEEQLAMTKGLFEDELFSASSESSKCFLEEFKDSAAREEIFFLRAEALRKGGDLQGAIKAYDELKKNFPSSKTYLDNSMLQKGISLALTRNYTASIRTLKLLLLDFPTTKYRDEALYWLGYAASFQAESLRKKNNKDALLFYQESALHFVKVEPELLNLKQQQELLHLMGRSWWFLKDFTKAEEAWSQYLKNSKSIKPEQALNLKYQLATGFQQEKNYKKAERWFARILTMHPDSKLAVVSAFLRAEMAYAVSVQETKTESLDSKAVSILIKHYKLYLNKNDNKYQALVYYRIGVLQQPHRPNEAIHAFQKYLSTKDKTYAAEVHYRLGYLFFNTKQQQKAIQIFEKYLRTKDKTYTNEVLYQLGFLYIGTKQQQKAVQIFENYLSTKDKTYTNEILYQLGFLYIESKRPKKAIQIFENYLSTKDKTYVGEVLYQLGFLYIEAKQQKKAVQIFENYLSTKDKTYVVEVLYQLGFLYIEAKQQKKAVQIFENYLSTKDKTYVGEVLYQLGFLYIEAKQQKKAVQIFENYLSTKDKTYMGEVLFRLGYLYLETKQAENAVDSFKKYLSLKDKTHVGEVQYQLGFLFTERKQQKKAIKIFEKYLAGDNEEHREEIQLRLGYLYAENKQQKKAIKIFEKYLASGAVGHIAETQLSLGYLYVENKKPFLAIAVLEQVLLHPDYQKNNDLLQTLLVLYRENVSEEKYLQFLLKVKNDPKQGGKVQQGFKSQLIIEYFEQNKCDKLIAELNPDYMQSIKKSNTKEWEHLLYMRGSCLIETKRWNEARIDLRQIRDTKKYREHSIQMLIVTHKQLEDWKRLTWEYQEVYDKKTPVLTIADYQLWVFAAKQRKDFQRLERIKIIYERWKKAFPEDSQNLEQLNKYISGFRLQELTSQENWKEVSAYIKKEVQSGSVSLDEQYFSQLLFAENKLENWSGVLGAYALLRKHDQKRAKTLDALINQAKAADKLGEKELSLKYYRQALKVKPLNQEDKKRQAEIKTFLAQSSFRKWIEQGEWSKISKTIRKEVAENKRVLNDTNFDLLLYTENQKSGNKKYNGILDAYALLATYDKKKTLTVKAQIDQGYAAAKLGGYKRAKGYYRRALKKTPDKDVDLVLQLVGELKRLYERSKDYASLVVIYKRAYSVLKKSPRPKNESRTYAYLIGYHQSFHLKQNDKARIWLMRSDGGGSTPQELDAAFWVAKLDRDANKPGMAIKRLKELAGRKVSKNSSLYVQIHFELGTLYHLKEKWKSALLHYRLVAKARAPAELKQYQNTAKEKAKEISSYLKSLNSSEG